MDVFNMFNTIARNMQADLRQFSKLPTIESCKANRNRLLLICITDGFNNIWGISAC